MSFFAVENLGVRFGGVVAVDGVNFSVQQGEVYTIIGPNGAGKTTIFNLIGLIYQPTTGRIVFQDHEMHGAPHDVAPEPDQFGSAAGRGLPEAGGWI